MTITHKINMDLIRRGIVPRIHTVQGDALTRQVEISLFADGIPWQIPGNPTVLIRYRRPDRVSGTYDTLPGGIPAGTISGSAVTITVAREVLTFPGDAMLVVTLVDGNRELSTFEFILAVQPNHSQSGIEGIEAVSVSGMIPAPDSARAGQILVIEEVDEFGLIRRMKAEDALPGTVISSIALDEVNSNDAVSRYLITMNDGSVHAFEVSHGKSAYAYAQEGGYTGTEAEFARKLAANSSGYPLPCVMDYGAKGDGTTDDTKAFQDALAENRVVYVPGGTYKLNGELRIRGNCCLELNQDTVLHFRQSSGNCISMEMSASICGRHGLVKVPYGFGGNVIHVATSLNDDVTAIEPWNKWDPQWKSGRYITDLNITKHDSNGFCYANQPGECAGTAIYISADRSGGTMGSTFIWGLDFSGIRIAGAFSYGIRAVNYDNAWNHEMRIDAFICSTEIGVSLEDCRNAYISATIQPRYAENNGTKTGVYAKHGIQLIRSENVDLTGSRVWDWNESGTLWQNGGQWQHIGMYGDCHGAILNSFEYYEVSTDIRKLIYTDTASNLEKLTILQEPFTRWFKPKDGKPYFFDGDYEKELTLKEEFDSCFVVDRTTSYTDALANAIDTDGSIYNGIGYSRTGGTINGSGGINTSGAGYYGHTGFIAVHDGAIVHVDGIKLTDDGDVRFVLYDANFQMIENRKHNAEHIIPGTSYWFPDYVATETGFSFRIAAYDSSCTYLRMGLLSRDIAAHPTIAVDEELIFTMDGYLAESIKVKGKNVVGAVTSWNDLLDKPFGEKEDAELLPKTEFQYDDSMEVFLAPGQLNLTVGNTYTVSWNGTDYTSEAVSGSFLGSAIVLVGNPAAVGGTNNGLPFAIACLEGMTGAISLDGSTSVTVGVRGHGIDKIPTEYLPYPPSYTIDLTEDEIASGQASNELVHKFAYVLENGGILFVKVGVHRSMVLDLWADAENEQLNIMFLLGSNIQTVRIPFGLWKPTAEFTQEATA